VANFDNWRVSSALFRPASSDATLAVFFGVLGGLAVFGLIGAIMGPVVIALAIAVVRWVEEGGAVSSPA